MYLVWCGFPVGQGRIETAHVVLQGSSKAKTSGKWNALPPVGCSKIYLEATPFGNVSCSFCSSIPSSMLHSRGALLSSRIQPHQSIVILANHQSRFMYLSSTHRIVNRTIFTIMSISPTCLSPSALSTSFYPSSTTQPTCPATTAHMA